MLHQIVTRIIGIGLTAVALLTAQDQTSITVLDEPYPNYSCSCTYHSDTEGTLLLRKGPFNDSGGPAYPDETVLLSSYPNPFNPTTTIRFDLQHPTDVRLTVYNLRGREVARLLEGTLLQGYHHVVWEGRDQQRRKVPSGIYIAQVLTPEHAKSIRLVLLK